MPSVAAILKCSPQRRAWAFRDKRNVRPSHSSNLHGMAHVRPARLGCFYLHRSPPHGAGGAQDSDLAHGGAPPGRTRLLQCQFTPRAQTLVPIETHASALGRAKFPGPHCGPRTTINCGRERQFARLRRGQTSRACVAHAANHALHCSCWSCSASDEVHALMRRVAFRMRHVASDEVHARGARLHADDAANLQGGRGRSWEVMGGHGRSWEIMGGHGRSWEEVMRGENVGTVREGRGWSWTVMDGHERSWMVMEGRRSWEIHLRLKSRHGSS